MGWAHNVPITGVELGYSNTTDVHVVAAQFAPLTSAAGQAQKCAS